MTLRQGAGLRPLSSPFIFYLTSFFGCGIRVSRIRRAEPMVDRLCRLSPAIGPSIPRKIAGNYPTPFQVWGRHSWRFGANEGLSVSVHPGQTATPAKVLRATGRYSIRRGDAASTLTSRLYTQYSLKAAEPHLDVLKSKLRRERVCYGKGMREESLLQ